MNQDIVLYQNVVNFFLHRSIENAAVQVIKGAILH